MLDLKRKRILVTGGAGFLGSHVMDCLRARGVPESAMTVPRSSTHDLRRREVCEEVVRGQDIVIHIAGSVGGIGFNSEHPGRLFYDNAIMGIQLMEAARCAGIEKFVQIGTVCAYPKFTPIPFREEDLWNGFPEETSAPYGIAKKMLIVQAQAYRKEYGLPAISLLLVNLYGPRDNFNLRSSHVVLALIRKVVEAQRRAQPWIEVWGNGSASREFLYVDDAAEGIVLATERYDGTEPVNLGVGFEVTIRELAEKICGLVGFHGEIRWDASKPDGQPRRMLDVSRAEREFGFRAQTSFDEGLRRTIEWFLQHGAAAAAGEALVRQSVHR